MLIHTHAHKELSVTSVFGAQRVLLMGEGAPRKARHSSHVSYTNDTTATISFGSPVHQAKENWVIYTVNISYFLPQNNVWILHFKDFFFSMRIIESFFSSCISIIYTFLIAQSNFHAESFSLCFNFSCKTTQCIIVVNSWRLEHDCVFSCYFRNKHVSVSFHLKGTATENFHFLIMFVNHSFARDRFLSPLCLHFWACNMCGHTLNAPSSGNTSPLSTKEL